MQVLITDLGSLVQTLKELATAAANANSANGGIVVAAGVGGRPTGYSSAGASSLRDLEGGGAGGGGAPGVMAKLLGLAQVLGRAAGLIPGQNPVAPTRGQLGGSSGSLGYLHSQSMQGHGDVGVGLGVGQAVGAGDGGSGLQRAGGPAMGGGGPGGGETVGAGGVGGARASRIAGTASLAHVGGLSTNRGIREAYPRLV